MSLLASLSRYRIDQIDVLLSDAAEALTRLVCWEEIQQTDAVRPTRASKRNVRQSPTLSTARKFSPASTKTAVTNVVMPILTILLSCWRD